MKLKSIVLAAIAGSTIMAGSLYAAETLKEHNLSAKLTYPAPVVTANKQNKQIKKINKKGNIFMHALKKVDLSKAQKTQIKQFRKESQQQRRKARKSFSKGAVYSKTDFNKKLYVSKGKEQANMGVDVRADLIGKTYGILTVKQKAQLFDAMKEIKKQRKAQRVAKRKQ